MTTLADVVVGTVIRLGFGKMMKASGGGAGYTLIPTLASETYLPERAVIFSKSGEWKDVTGYDQQNLKILHDSFSTPAQAGDTIVLMGTERIALEEVINAVNAGLRRMGPLHYKTTLPPGENPLPDGLISVESVVVDGKNAPYRLIPPSSASAAKVYIDSDSDAEVIYSRYHPEVAQWNDTLYDVFSPELAIACAGTVIIQQYIARRKGQANQFWLQLYAEMEKRVQEARVLFQRTSVGNSRRRKIVFSPEYERR